MNRCTRLSHKQSYSNLHSCSYQMKINIGDSARFVLLIEIAQKTCELGSLRIGASIPIASLDTGRVNAKLAGAGHKSR